MSKTIIKVENLGKKYQIGERQSYYSLRDSISGLFSKKKKSVDEFWALKDVNFEVKQGESVGIIGRNGAGKSTLLKILSRITPPTTGKITLDGRVASLLEVGTGFNPELTGRENIFLNGAILGMKQSEIKRKFDEIVAFSEVEKFLDMPVKHYSSGMYMRLAFAVAAHLESEILIVDEVLAVGDAQFQKKCLGKMGEVTKNEGRTVLFVSHNMGAIKQLCQRAVLLDAGEIKYFGKVDETLNRYISSETENGSYFRLKRIIDGLPDDSDFELVDVEVYQNKQLVWESVTNGDDIVLKIHFKLKNKTTGLRVYVDVCDVDNDLIFRTFHDGLDSTVLPLETGEYISSLVIPGGILGPINYNIYIQAGVYNQKNCLPFNQIKLPLSVIQTGKYNRAYPGDTFRGKLAVELEWKTLVYKSKNDN